MTGHPVRVATTMTFYVYACPGLSLAAAAERLARALPVRLARRAGACRGEYYRWSGEGGADLLLQQNVVDEEGRPVEPDAPAGEPLLYVTGLPAGVRAVLHDVEGLRLVAADAVEIPPR